MPATTMLPLLQKRGFGSSMLEWSMLTVHASCQHPHTSRTSKTIARNYKTLVKCLPTNSGWQLPLSRGMQQIHPESTQTISKTTPQVFNIPNQTLPAWLAKIREMMASSPSTIHFRHYIAALANSTVAKIDAILANVELLSSSTPDRWKQP